MTTHAGAAQFLARFFGTPRTAAPVFVTSLPNVRGEKRFPPRRVTTRDPDDIERFADKWDQPERALYFCVATVKQGCERSKATLEELTCLHTDLDYKSIARHRPR